MLTQGDTRGIHELVALYGYVARAGVVAAAKEDMWLRE